MKSLRYFDQINDVMTRSGQLVMGYYKKDFEIFKKTGTSLVTTADIENERFLMHELSQIVPQAGFIAEESGIIDAHHDYMWVIDPLDGTRNFVHGLPHFCIMIALMYKNELIMSAIYEPVTQQLYYAEQGKGAWLDGTHRIHVNDRCKQTRSVIVVGDDTAVHIARKALGDSSIHVSRRYFGSAGLDAVFLATGVIDVMVAEHIAWWDVAAGMLLIREVVGLQCHYKKKDAHSLYGTLKAGKTLFF